MHQKILPLKKFSQQIESFLNKMFSQNIFLEFIVVVSNLSHFFIL